MRHTTWRPTRTCAPLYRPASLTPLQFILKNTAFGTAFAQLRRVEPRQFRQKRPPGSEPHFSLLIDFKGEHVAGEGGPYRQFFTDVARELRTPHVPLLVPCPNAQAKLGANRDKFLPSAAAKTRGLLRMFRFLGQLMGMAIRTGTLLALDLAPLTWKQLVGEAVTRRDLAAVDEAFVNFLRFLKECPADTLEGPTRSIFEHFVVQLSDKSRLPLVKGGEQRELTVANRGEFIALAEAARLHEAAAQVVALHRGLADVVPAALLALCTHDDLLTRVCGKPFIDVKLLRRHTEYSGVAATAPHVAAFWHVLDGLHRTTAAPLCASPGRRVAAVDGRGV